MSDFPNKVIITLSHMYTDPLVSASVEDANDACTFNDGETAYYALMKNEDDVVISKKEYARFKKLKERSKSATVSYKKKDSK